MNIELDDDKQRIYGEETITYYNNSPDVLSYLWVQLDQNMRAKDSDTYKISSSSINERSSMRGIKRMMGPEFSDYDGGFKLEYVKNASGQPMAHTVNKTMMRIDLDTPLKSGEKVEFSIKWWYNINDRMAIGVVAQVMNISQRTTTTFILLLSFSQEWPRTQIMKVGRTSNFLEVVSLL